MLWAYDQAGCGDGRGRAASWFRAGLDVEGEQGGVIGGPATGVPGQNLAEAADGGGRVQAVSTGQGIG